MSNQNDNLENPDFLRDLETSDEEVVNTDSDLAFQKLNIRKDLIDKILLQEEKLSVPRQQTKDKIITFLKWELIFLGCFISLILFSHGALGWFSGDEFSKILNIITFLVTSIIVEFISMIFFIVRYLFNTKLIDVLEKWFKDI